MKTCCCTLPFLDPKACDMCGYHAEDGKFFIPFDPAKFNFEIHDDKYVLWKKDAN